MDGPVQRMQSLIGKVLILGVIASGALVAFGGGLYLARHGFEPPHYQVFHGEPADLRTISGVLRDTMALSGRGIIQLGLGVLVGVQLVRVALTVWLFRVARDRAYIAISLFVLAVLVYSIFSKA
jgi:uncharacterized membrane protein